VPFESTAIDVKYPTLLVLSMVSVAHEETVFALTDAVGMRRTMSIVDTNSRQISEFSAAFWIDLIRTLIASPRSFPVR